MIGERNPKALLLVLIACLAADLVFLKDTLFSDDVRAPSMDIANAMPYGREPDQRPEADRNPFLTDWSYSIHSWQKLVRTSYRRGELPLWNDRAGCGQPLIGNLQAETFSPYQPLNVLGGDQYVDYKQFAQLLVAQLGAVILAWVLGLSGWSALILALGYSYGSYMQSWAVHPVAGSAAFGPMILAAFLAARQRFSVKVVTAGGLAIAASMLAGHPESTFWACFASCAVAFLMSRNEPAGAGLKSRLLFIPQCLLIGTIGVLLAACQILPFVEYQSESALLLIRGAAPKHLLPTIQVYSLLDARAFGFPDTANGYFGHGNYPESIVHVGQLVLCLALAGFIGGLVRRIRPVLPLFILSVAGVALAFAPAAVHEALDIYPINIMPLLRLHYFASLLLPVLAAIGLHVILEDLREKRHAGFIAALIAGLILTAAGISMDVVGQTWMTDDGAVMPRFSLFAGCLFFLALPFSIFVCSRLQKGGIVLGTVVSAAVFAQAWMLWGSYIGPSPVKHLEPRSVPLSYIESRKGDLRLLPAVSQLPPELGNLQAVTSLRTYDGMGMKRLFSLLYHQRAFLGVPVHAPIFRVNPETLDMLSVGWTLTEYRPELSPFPFMEVFAPPGQSQAFPYVCKKGQQLEFIVSQPENLPIPPGALSFQVGTGENALNWKVGEALPESPLGVIHRTADFPAETYRKRLERQRGSPHFYVAFRPGDSVQDGTTVNGRLRVSEHSPRLLIRVLVRGGLGAKTVFEHKKLFVGSRETAVPRAYLAAATRFIEPAPESDLARTMSERLYTASIKEVSLPTFNAREQTIIESEERSNFRVPASDRTIVPVAIKRLGSGRFTMDVDTQAAGVLVFSECHAKGWTASIDGKETDILPANVCSMAIAMPAGKHKVEFTYRPRTLVWGIILSPLTLLVLLTLWVRNALRARRLAP